MSCVFTFWCATYYCQYLTYDKNNVYPFSTQYISTWSQSVIYSVTLNYLRTTSNVWHDTEKNNKYILELIVPNFLKKFGRRNCVLLNSHTLNKSLTTKNTHLFTSVISCVSGSSSSSNWNDCWVSILFRTTLQNNTAISLLRKF